jgi:hypothetical protein
MAFKFGRAKEVASREDEGVWFHVHDECDEPLFYENEKPVRMKVAGSYSSRFNRLNEALQRRKWKAGTTPDEIQNAYREEVVAKCILEWEGFTDEGDVPVPLDPKYAKEAVHTAWLYPQITRAMDDHKSFFSESSKDS